MDETAVLRQAPDDRVFLHELELILPRTAPLDQLTDHPKSIGAVRLREFAGLLDLLVLMAIRQAQSPLKDAGAFDTAIVQHGFGPALAVGTEQRGAAELPSDSTFDAADLLGGDVLVLRAEPSRLLLDVEGDLLHAPVEQANRMAVPPRPEFPAEILGRSRVVGLVHFDVPVAVNRALGLVK